MKKFFTAIPLQVQEPLQKYKYESVDNSKLNMSEKTSFPIIPIINGYAQKGETIRVIALVTGNPVGEKNYKELCEEVESICDIRGLTCPKGVEKIVIPENQNVATHVSTFQQMIDFVEDDDELFACMTFGTKPLCQAMLMAVQYAYRIKQNTSIECIAYGEIKRPNDKESEWVGRIYDMTALIQLDEIVRVLAERKTQNPKAMIDRILDL